MRTIIGLITVGIMLLGPVAVGEVPEIVNYQGRLEEWGAPMTGTVNLTFRFYDLETGGSLLLTVEQNGVQVNDGIFNVAIGTGTITAGAASDLSQVFRENVDVWLGVEVGADGEMSPRQKMASVPYALHGGEWTDEGTYIYANNATDVVVTDDGKVGIGTTTPAEALTFHGGILREGSVAYGPYSNTHVNLGVNSRTDNVWNIDFEGATVVGGAENVADENFSTVGGGYRNIAGRKPGVLVAPYTYQGYETVSGGSNNASYWKCATVGGGMDNTSNAQFATVSGGEGNLAASDHSTVGGGFFNRASGTRCVVSGGQDNTAGSGSTQAYATVGGGKTNSALGPGSSISGGVCNIVKPWGFLGTVGGGDSNSVNGTCSTVSGGAGNLAGSPGCCPIVGIGLDCGDGMDLPMSPGGAYATVGGGLQNTATGYGSVVPGGEGNVATASYSLAGGHNMCVSELASKTFAWGYAASPVTIDQPDAFIVYSGDVGIGTTTPGSKLDVNGDANIDGSATMTSANINTFVQLTPTATPPASPTKGTVYMDDTTSKLMVYDGSVWQACW